MPTGKKTKRSSQDLSCLQSKRGYLKKYKGKRKEDRKKSGMLPGAGLEPDRGGGTSEGNRSFYQKKKTPGSQGAGEGKHEKMELESV